MLQSINKSNTKQIMVLIAACLVGRMVAVCQNLDSLKDLTYQKQGPELVDVYLKIGETFDNKFGATDSLMFYSTKSYHHAIKINDQLGALKAISNIGLAYAKQNDITTSSNIWNKILQQEKIKDPLFIGHLHLRIGLNENFLNNDDRAMEHFIKAVKYFKDVNDNDGLGLAYCRIAYLFSTQKQYDKVIDYCHQATSLIPATQNQYARISMYSTITGLYIQVGTQDPAYIDSAIIYGTKALAMAIKYEFYTKGSQLCNSLSAAYNMKGNNAKALEYLNTATRFNPFLYKGEAIITYLNLSDAYAGLKQYDPCLQYLDSSALIASQLNDLYYDMAVAEREYAYNKEAGEFQEALIGLEKFKIFEDSLFTKEKVTGINEIHTKYQTELKDAEIKNLNQTKKLDQLKIVLLIIGIVVAILGIILLLIIFRQRSLSQQQKINEAEIRLSRSRINPHFFFNAMAALQSQALNEQDNTRIALYLSKYAKIMRLTLEGSYNLMVTVESELDFIVQYMDLQKLRTKNKFDYEIQLDETSDITLLKVPSMILQPFIENSVEHGFANINYPGKITISIHIKNNNLEIIIDDNGMGGASERHVKEFPSRATSIMKDRLFLLTQKIKKQADFEMIKKDHENGFQVKIHLPIIEA